MTLTPETVLLGGLLLLKAVSVYRGWSRPVADTVNTPDAPHADGVALDFELVGDDGEVRHSVHTSKFTVAPPEFCYGDRTYILTPSQPRAAVRVYMEKPHA